MSFSVSRASTTKHSVAGELLQVHPRGKSIKSRLTSVIRRRTTSGAGEEDTGASHINSLLDDVQEFEQELERFYWHTKELKSKLTDAFNASYNMVADALQLWRNQPASTTDLQECQRVLAEVNEMYQRQIIAEIDRELLGPIGADMTMFKVIKEKTARREQYLRDVKYYKNKMEGLDASRDPERYSRNEEKLFSVQAAVVEETKSLFHDMKEVEHAKQTMLERYVPKAVAIQRELWTTVAQHSQHLDALASIARIRRLVPIGESPCPSTADAQGEALNPRAAAAQPAVASTSTTAPALLPAGPESTQHLAEAAPAALSEESRALPKGVDEEVVPFSKKVLSSPEPIPGLDLEFEVTLNTERAPGLVLHKRLVQTSDQLRDIEYAAVNLVLPGSVADLLGIRKGDIITRVNGMPVVNAAFDSVKEEIKNYVKPMTVQFARVSNPEVLASPPARWGMLAEETEELASEYGEDDLVEAASEDPEALSSSPTSSAAMGGSQVPSPSGTVPNSPGRTKTPMNTPRADVSAKREALKLQLQGIPEGQQAAEDEPRRLALPVVRDVADDEQGEEVPLASSPISDIRNQLANAFEKQPDLEAALLPRIAPLPLAAAPPETEFQVAAPTPFSTPLQRTSKSAAQHRLAAYSSSSFDASSGASTPFTVEEGEERDEDEDDEHEQQDDNHDEAPASDAEVESSQPPEAS